jgi:hypothetical protein
LRCGEDFFIDGGQVNIVLKERKCLIRGRMIQGFEFWGSSEEPNKLNFGGLKSRNFDIAQC